MSTVPSTTPAPPAANCLGRLITCRVDKLQPHPSLVRLHIVPSAFDLSVAIEQRGHAITEPLTITQDRCILSGYARWEMARRCGETTLSCLQLDMTEEEALLWIIQKHQRTNGLNDFSRILLAMELEPWFRQRARHNQQLGGQRKGSSNLAEADRRDVRAEIAQAAGVSTGNVSKVRQLVSVANYEVMQALGSGEVSIHQAYIWLQEPEKQLDHLRMYRDLRGIAGKITALLHAHRSRTNEELLDPHRIVAALTAMTSEQRKTVLVAEIKIPGEVLLLSTGLLQALESQGELQS